MRLDNSDSDITRCTATSCDANGRSQQKLRRTPNHTKFIRPGNPPEKEMLVAGFGVGKTDLQAL